MIQRDIDDAWRFNDFRDSVINNKVSILNTIFKEINTGNEGK